MDRTRKNIIDAFNRLIEKADLEDITASMIAKEADVSKATFYRYFKDKYDVMNCNFKNLLDRCVQKSNNYRDMFYYIFKEFEEEWHNRPRIFNSTGTNSMENYIYHYSLRVAKEITKQNRGGKGMTPEEAFQADVFCFGISHMYKKWANGDYPLSAQKAADLLYSIVPEGLKHSWFLISITDEDS